MPEESYPADRQVYNLLVEHMDENPTTRALYHQDTAFHFVVGVIERMLPATVTAMRAQHLQPHTVRAVTRHALDLLLAHAVRVARGARGGPGMKPDERVVGSADYERALFQTGRPCWWRLNDGEWRPGMFAGIDGKTGEARIRYLAEDLSPAEVRLAPRLWMVDDADPDPLVSVIEAERKLANGTEWHAGTPVVCGDCGAHTTMRSLLVSANCAVGRADPHYRRDGSGLCQERAEDARRKRAVRRAREEILERVRAVAKSTWPCLCADARRESDPAVDHCPRHVLGPALLATIERES